MASISNIVLAISIFSLLTACQTVYYDRGSGPIHLKRKSVASLKRYEAYDTLGSFAVTSDGRHSSYIYCSSGSCSSDVTDQAIRLCKVHHNKDCKIFAIGREVVWNGPITYEQTPAGEHTLVVAVSIAPGTGKHINYSGKAIESNGGKTLNLFAHVSDADCSGTAYLDTGKWNLTCANDVDYSGAFHRTDRPLYRGDGGGTNGRDATLYIFDKSEILSRFKVPSSKQ